MILFRGNVIVFIVRLNIIPYTPIDTVTTMDNNLILSASLSSTRVWINNCNSKVRVSILKIVLRNTRQFRIRAYETHLELYSTSTI